MKSAQITLLLLLLLAVLFALGVGVGFSSGSTWSSADFEWWKDWLKGFFKEEPVAADQLKVPDGCLDGKTFVLLPSRECSIQILRAEARVRSMKLRLIEGFGVKALFETKGESGTSLELKLDTRQTESPPLSIVQEGDGPVVATLLLRCESPGPSGRCRLQFQ